MRSAIVTGARSEREIAAYLPYGYKVVPGIGGKVDGRPFWIIAGEDQAGWTLEGYVIPRLASGLIVAKEITL